MVTRILTFKDCGVTVRNRSARKSWAQRTAFQKAAVFNQPVKESKAGKQKLDFEQNMVLTLGSNQTVSGLKRVPRRPKNLPKNDLFSNIIFW